MNPTSFGRGYAINSVRQCRQEPAACLTASSQGSLHQHGINVELVNRTGMNATGIVLASKGLYSGRLSSSHRFQHVRAGGDRSSQGHLEYRGPKLSERGSTQATFPSLRPRKQRNRLSNVRQFSRLPAPNQDEHQNTRGDHQYAPEPHQFNRHRCLLSPLSKNVKLAVSNCF